MTRQWMKVISTLAVILFSSSPALAGGSSIAAYLPRLDAPKAANSCEDPKARLAEVAKGAGYGINEDQTVIASNQDMTSVVSSIAGFENVPARGFIEGADMGFMYLDAPGSGIPAGYYRLNAQAAADDIKVGEYSGTVQLIDTDGKAVARLPANFQTSSLEVPNELPFPRTTVSAMVSLKYFPRWHISTTTYVFYCPNGSIIIFEVTTISYY